jgi:hypothetical protein
VSITWRIRRLAGVSVSVVPAALPPRKQETQLRHRAEQAPPGIDHGDGIEVVPLDYGQQWFGIILPVDDHRVACHHVLDSRSVTMCVGHA